MEKQCVSDEALIAQFPELEKHVKQGDLRIVEDERRRTIRIANTAIFTVDMMLLHDLFYEFFKGYDLNHLKPYGGIVGVDFSVELSAKKKL